MDCCLKLSIPVVVGARKLSKRMGCSVKPRNLIEPVMFIYMLIVFLQYPAVQSLFYAKICANNFNETVCQDLTNSTHKNEESFVQKHTSHWILYLNLALLVPSIFSAMVLGRIGDAVSRKWAILSPIIGQFICSIVYIVNAYYIHLNLAYILIGPLISGIFGGFTSFIMSVYSYLSHTTEKSERAVRMGILEALTFFAATIGFVVVGVLMDNYGYVVVFGLIVGLTSLVLVYTIFIIEDITPDTNATKKEIVHIIFSMEGYRNFVNFFRKDREPKQNLILVLGTLVICILMFITAGDIDLAIIYLLHPPLSMTKSYISYYLGLDNVIKALALLILFPLFKKCFKISDCFWGLIGVLSKSAGAALFGSSHVVWLIFCVPVVRIFQGFPSAVIRSLLSSIVENSEQGQLFAVVASSESIITVVASLVYNPLYAATIDINPGISFYISSGIGLVGAVVVGVIWKLSANSYTYKVMENDTIQSNKDDTIQSDEEDTVQSKVEDTVLSN